MGIFNRAVPINYVPIHPDNIKKKDWIILLEAGTIIGPSPERLRVALATTERKIVTKYNVFLKPKHFLVLDGYDPRIHRVFFCPQLYKHDSDGKLVPLEGDEIGNLLVQQIQDAVVQKHPWYEPIDKLPAQPAIPATADTDFETLVVGKTERASESLGRRTTSNEDAVHRKAQ
jgi:hypothetical protein